MENVDLLDQAPDHAGGMEVADGAEPADAGQDSVKEEEPIKTLTQRMMAIRSECAGIGKENIKMQTKSGKEFSIQAHTIEGVLHGVRNLFDKHGVWMQPQLVERVYNGNRCDAVFDFYFENVDDADDCKIVRFAGSGTDNSDKGFAKAGTNALKEMLKKVFLITDREDAKEETDQIEYRSNEGATRAEVDEATNQARDALLSWAKTFKSSLENAQSTKDVERLMRENKDQLTSADLPEVTRSFFIELIERRKQDLSGEQE